MDYLFGRSVVTERIHQLIFVFFIVVGSVLTLGSILNFADAVLFLLALVNIIGCTSWRPWSSVR